MWSYDLELTLSVRHVARVASLAVACAVANVDLPCAHVVVDAVKIVDRMEFSFANFSPNILKGWDKPGRN